MNVAGEVTLLHVVKVYSLSHTEEIEKGFASLLLLSLISRTQSASCTYNIYKWNQHLAAAKT